MGIKGIYKEIGPGKRVSLCKLAIDHLEQTGQPLRLAIDFAIWSFQAQAARGGANPAIRTLFYRLVRLLSHSIVPLFVFDGPNKPLFKRNKRSRGPGDNISVAMAKRLIKHFGFHMHDAPGEAEAECALLQQQGVVDAVLSEDVDTIMFGCTFTLRNWSAEGSRAAKTPTHVSVYDVAELRQGETGLDREGMVLVALMSGGDYIPEGVPGCGVKVACEAARAGFGRRLCRIKRSDPEALARWREELTEELRTNKSKLFRTRHKALTIPEEFPSVEVLRYYTHPVVSQAATVDKLKREFPKKKAIDIEGLRAFTAETFDWVYKIGAVKFIRVLAPSLLVQALLSLSYEELETDEPDVRQEVEGKLVRSINIRRTHLSTDGTPELRVSYIPNDVVGIDLDAEEDEVVSTYGRSGLALNSDDEVEEQVEDAEAGPKKVFDPLQPDLAWVPETVAKLGVPLAVEDWEEKQRIKQRGKPKKTQAKGSRKKATEMPVGTLDKYVKCTKPGASESYKEMERAASFIASSPPAPSLPPLPQQVSSRGSAAATRGTEARPSLSAKHTSSNSSKPTKSKTKGKQPRLSLDINPWTLTSSQATPRAKRPAAVPEAIYISSSPTNPASRQGPGPLEVAQSSALSHLDDNSQDVPPSSPDPFSPMSSPSTRKNATGVPLSPRKHNHPSRELSKRPTAKRTQKPNGAAAVRSGSPTRLSTHSRRTPDAPAQASIKTFGRLSEAMGKKNMISETKAADPLPNSDDELEELHNLGSKYTSKGTGAAVSSSKTSSSKRAGRKDGGASLLSRNGAEEVVEIPSSPLAWSPPRAVPTKSKTTSLYVPRTSDAGYGYFREIEVSPEAADRMMAGQSKEPDRRPGSKRIWRQSEVSILDLTGED
ncbi:hypothetical protein VM1G_03196 [Cytospora mali]|uniref:Flap endonuclease GEN 1 n=1 Tax=Cytospora mali TaxID=578113 RepID=A0A194VTZ0_CYTMA|nr:hypothetical protein VM1G_03196 [Valsa mali]